jgi:cysteine desulfurase
MPGGGQERGRRGGTENVAGIVGFGEAARLAAAERDLRHARWTEFRALLRVRVLGAFTEAIVNETPQGENAANILSFSFPAVHYDVDGAAMLMNCDLAGLSVSGGSACTAGSIEASHVMRAIGHDPATGAATVRVSFGAQTTKEDVDAGTAILIRVLQEMDDRSSPRSHSLSTTP